MLPYWSAFTKAYINEDISWIKNTFKKLYVLWFIQILFVVFQIFVSAHFYKLWVGDKITISFPVTIALGVYSIVFNWNNIFAFFLNGVSKIKLQLYSAIFVGIVNLPLTYILIKYGNFGPLAIIVANTICLLISSIWSPIQCYKILNNTAKGIWNE
jgi:O-antigen/teichoic acid export membrane protein